ncbi:hypothetical protein [Sphingopyxis sp.]|uniref:hypothetical protein n=1 Tax=Sphingopyxis sp. TaxID=1908224 RepID=UPI003D139FAA
MILATMMMTVAMGPQVHAKDAAATDLNIYVGKYPFDAVNGHRFLDHPAVKAALVAAVPDAKQRATIAFAENSLGLPIVRVAGGRILIWGGEWRAEDRYNWAVVIAPDGSKPEVCIYDGVGYGQDFQSSSWFVTRRAVGDETRNLPVRGRGLSARRNRRGVSAASA